MDERGSANQELKQDLVGVGLELLFDAKARELTGVAPLAEAPAFKAGVRSRDRIVAIDGKPRSELRKGKLVRGTAISTLQKLDDGAAPPKRLTFVPDRER